MSVLAVRELPRRESTRNLVGFTRTYTRVFEVITTAASDGPNQVLADSRLPSDGQVYITDTESDVAAYLIERSPSEKERLTGGGSLWIVSCKYSTSIQSEGFRGNSSAGAGMAPSQQFSNPLARPLTWKLSFSKTTEFREKDENDQPIIVSNGAPCEGGLPREIARPLISVTWYAPTVDLSWLETYIGAINSFYWEGFEARTLKVLSLEVDDVTENGITCLKKSVQMEVNRDKWNYNRQGDTVVLTDGTVQPVSGTNPGGTRVLNAGYFELVSGASMMDPKRPRVIRDANMRPVNSPYPLTQEGGKLAVGQPLTYRTYNLYREANFAANLIDGH